MSQVTKRRTKDPNILDTRNEKPRAWRGLLFIEDKLFIENKEKAESRPDAHRLRNYPSLLRGRGRGVA
jgi:hypothetical protein